MAALALTFTASTNAQNVVVKSPKLGTDNANPVLDFLYCADPTAVEYNGRLYVYGTNDHQQYEEAEKNSYENVYTYNDDWSEHEPWTLGGEKPTRCSMVYLTSTDPLNPQSWTYGGNYFKNPGDNGMGDGNNHTHLHKYQGKWYLFYHTGLLEKSLGSDGGFRSIYVDEIDVDEKNVVLHECKPTQKGVTAIKNLDACQLQYAATSAATLGVRYIPTAEPGHTVATVGTPNKIAPKPSEGIIEVRNVSFAAHPKQISCKVKGNGSATFRLDSQDGATIATITSNNGTYQTISSATSKLKGVHTLHIVLEGDIQLDTWQFKK